MTTRFADGFDGLQERILRCRQDPAGRVDDPFLTLEPGESQTSHASIHPNMAHLSNGDTYRLIRGSLKWRIDLLTYV